MRDHKISFMEPKPFVRWRSSRIVYFGLSRPPHPLSHCLQQHQQHQQLQPQNSAAVSVPVPVPASVPEAIASSISENPALINTSALLDAGIDVGINKDTEFASFGQQHGSAAVQEGDMSNVLRPAGRTLTSPEVYFYGPGELSLILRSLLPPDDCGGNSCDNDDGCDDGGGCCGDGYVGGVMVVAVVVVVVMMMMMTMLLMMMMMTTTRSTTDECSHIILTVIHGNVYTAISCVHVTSNTFLQGNFLEKYSSHLPTAVGTFPPPTAVSGSVSAPSPNCSYMMQEPRPPS